MRIAGKIALSLAVVVTAVLCLVYVVQRPRLISNFEQLQHKKATSDLVRSREVVLTELEALGKQTQDWASWDDTYRFVQDRNEEYASTNLTDNLFETSHFDLIWILNAKSEVVHGRSRLPDGRLVDKIEGFDPVLVASGGSGQIKLSSASPTRGVHFVAGFPAVISVRPIVDSSEESPARGILIIGRYLTPSIVKDMSSSIRVGFTIFDPAESLTQASAHKLAERFDPSTRTYVTHPRVDQPVTGFTYLYDCYGKPSLLIRSETSPDILAEGVSTVNETYRSMALISMLAALAGMAFIHFSVSAPLQRFANQVSELGRDDVVELENGMTDRKDEIGIFARSFQGLLQRLDSTMTRLMHVSREAGMAEVARGILHNAGNVLNSLSISARQVEQMAEGSNPAGLRKALQMLKEHDGNLDEFLKNDPKGVKLLPYLESFADKLEADHAWLTSESKTLVSSSKHLEQIVQGQEVLAAKNHQNCRFRLSSIVSEAAQLLGASLRRHEIELEWRVDPSLITTGDPSKLLQVLTNLTANAKDALLARAKDRKIEVFAQLLSQDKMELRIRDNGQGISAEDQTRIFQHGFTTRDEGSGYGLHFCANAATEMGWELSVQSEGPGTGATFILTMPIYSDKEMAA